MNVIRRHWFPYGKGILTYHPSSWILRNETIRPRRKRWEKFGKLLKLVDNYTEYESQVRKWARWCEIGTSKKPFVRANQDEVVSLSTEIVLLDLLLQTHEFDFKMLLKFCLIIDGTYDDSSNTGCSIKVHVLAALWVKMWRKTSSKARLYSLMSSTKLRQQYLHTHTFCAIEKPYTGHLQWDKWHTCSCV